MYVSRLPFSEENDAKPTYALAAITFAVFILDQLARHLLHYEGRFLFGAGCLMTMSTAIMAIYCLAGCIWHPIPKDRRANDGMTTLNLSLTAMDESAPAQAMFSQLDDETSIVGEEEVDASQAELRDKIEWKKFFLVAACVAGNVALLVALAH